MQKNSLDCLSVLVEKTVTRWTADNDSRAKSRALLSKFDGGTTEREEGNEEEVEEKKKT